MRMRLARHVERKRVRIGLYRDFLEKYERKNHLEDLG
jgi:hypothetical protein